jgi:hypothetical protein
LRRALIALQIVLVLLAAAAIALPLPAPFVERYYADSFYPSLQAQLTSWSNTSAFSLFDALVIVLALVMLVAWGRWVAQAWRVRSAWPILRALRGTLLVAAVVYLWFAVAWGLNYSRPPLEAAIGYDAARVTPAAVRAMAARAVDEVNSTHAAGHAAGFPAATAVPRPLVNALHEVERRLGRPRATTPSRPKRTLLGMYFRASGVDGMHAPFLLETLLNPDLTPPERPVVLAHEWAHLAGYAPEDDASFVGVLTALRGDAASRYSAWLSVFHDAAGQLPVAEQRQLIARLGPGPQADRRAISARLEARVDAVARVSWETYDQYLKSQGVEEGVRSYSRVVQLLLGSGALDWQ